MDVLKIKVGMYKSSANALKQSRKVWKQGVGNRYRMPVPVLVSPDIASTVFTIVPEEPSTAR